MPGVYNFLHDGIEFLTLIDVLRSKKLSYDDFVQELQSTLPVVDPLLKRYNSRINLKQIAEEDKMNSQGLFRPLVTVITLRLSYDLIND